MKKVKIEKVKVSKTDLKNFTKESLKIDPFWSDLYNPPQKNIKKH